MHHSPRHPKAAYLLSKEVWEVIYPDWLQREISSIVDITPGIIGSDCWRDHTTALASVEVLFSGWGMVPLDREFLEATPSLRVVLYGAGSVRGFYTDEARQRGVRICSAWQANAVPVAEFSYATILLSLKRVWRVAETAKQTRSFRQPLRLPGAFRTKVGMVSMGAIGRRVANWLKNHDLEVMAYDPYVDEATLRSLGVRRASLEEIFATCQVVSLHTPNLEETAGLITGDLIRSMPDGATLINTARGAVIREDEMIDVLRDRPDLTAMLDVTHPEPPPQDSPLWDLSNVILTPHIAGSIDGECARMGEYMLDELRRYLAGEPLKFEVTPDLFLRMA